MDVYRCLDDSSNTKRQCQDREENSRATKSFFCVAHVPTWKKIFSVPFLVNTYHINIHTVMFQSVVKASRSTALRSMSVSTRPSISKSDLLPLKINSNGSDHLYAIFKLHNMPYLVTKGDKVYLPFKLKNAEVGDQLVLNNVTTIGSPDYTYNDSEGIPKNLYNLKANVVEITKEPYYEVTRTKQRCRRLKTFPVQPFQTVLMINELKLV